MALLTAALADLPALYSASCEELTRVREKVRQQPLGPYEQIDTSQRECRERIAATADALIRDGWRFLENPAIALTPPINWCPSVRSKAYHLQALDPVGDLLLGYSELGTTAYLSTAHRVAEDWIRVHQAGYFGAPLADGIRAALCTKEPDFSWYDMAVGQRVYRMAYLADVIGRRDDYSDDQFARLLRSVLFHLAVLRDDKFFKAHNNHGLYQALGQLAAARRFAFLPALEPDVAQARARCSQMIDRSYFPSGPHREHSPAYHRMILGSLAGATKAGLMDAQQIDRLASAEEALRWMVQPNGQLAPIGDTDRVRHALRDPPCGVKPYYDAGYAFARYDRCYLAQIAGFHSRVHKHADHLSFIWHDRGREVLTDPGRFAYEGVLKSGPLYEEGFWYAHPSRIYVESTRAHNTVEIDGRNFPRKRVPFTGSSLQYAGEQNGLVVTSCETRHFRTIRHWRGLVLLPGTFLLVMDWLHDSIDREHEYRQNFHLAPEWSAETHGGTVCAQAFTDQLFAVSLLPQTQIGDVIRGRDGDDMYGWISDRPYSLVPSPSFDVAQVRGRGARFATLFSFDAPPQPDSRHCRTNSSFAVGRFVWHAKNTRYSLDLDRSKAVPRVTLHTRSAAPRGRLG